MIETKTLIQPKPTQNTDHLLNAIHKIPENFGKGVSIKQRDEIFCYMDGSFYNKSRILFKYNIENRTTVEAYKECCEEDKDSQKESYAKEVLSLLYGPIEETNPIYESKEFLDIAMIVLETDNFNDTRVFVETYLKAHPDINEMEFMDALATVDERFKYWSAVKVTEEFSYMNVSPMNYALTLSKQVVTDIIAQHLGIRIVLLPPDNESINIKKKSGAKGSKRRVSL